MFNFLAATFGRPQARPRAPADPDTQDAAFSGPVRYRPRLTIEVLHDHELTRQQMRALLDAREKKGDDRFN